MLKQEDMHGPTDEAKRLQFVQHNAREAMYDAWNDAVAKFGHKDYDAANKDPAYLQRKDDYEASVTALDALLGVDAPCNFVDCDLWSLFSDCYKDDVGMRPRFHQSRAQVNAYFAARRQSQSEQD